jgi:transposase
MAKRTTIVTEVAQVAEEAGNEGVSGSVGLNTHYRDLGDALKKRQRARRVEALSLKLSGFSTAQIAERMGIQPDTVRKLINRTLATAENRAAEQMREIENARLDRAQAAIWSQVLTGEYRAVTVFLQISQRRARLNGLDAAASLVISPNVRGEMERALADLQQVLGMVVDDQQTEDPFDLPLADEWTSRRAMTETSAIRRRSGSAADHLLAAARVDETRPSRTLFADPSTRSSEPPSRRSRPPPS